MIKVRTRSNSASSSVPVSKQVKIQFQDEGVNLEEKGTVDVVNFVGSAVSVARVGDTIVITITGGAGSSAWGGITGTLSDQTDLFSALGLAEVAAQTNDFTFALTDLFRTVPINAATTKTGTVPANATVAFPIGTAIGVKWQTAAAGQPAVAAAVGVTINNTAGNLLVPAVNVTSCLVKTATNTWTFFNGLAGGAGSGDVVGPSSAVADRIAVFDSTSGKLIKDGGVTVAGLQPIDADLTAIAALSSAADKLPYATGAQTWALTDLSSFIRTLLDDANAAAARTTLGVGSGTGDVVGPGSATASAMAEFDGTTGKLIKDGGVVVTSFAKTLLDDGDAATARTTLGITAGVSRVVITSPVVNNNATPLTWESITGLSFPVVADKRFAFKFVIPYTSAATSNGGAFSISGPTLTITAYRVIHATANATFLPSYREAYDISTAPTSSSATAMLATIEGIIECSSAASEVIARFQSELSGQAITALAYSYVEYVQIN